MVSVTRSAYWMPPSVRLPPEPAVLPRRLRNPPSLPRGSRHEESVRFDQPQYAVVEDLMEPLSQPGFSTPPTSPNPVKRMGGASYNGSSRNV